MTEFFFEIRSGEIPALMQRQGLMDLERLLKSQLDEYELTFESLSGFVGPRRMGAVVTGLSHESPEKSIEKRGPRVTAPQKAIDGFLASTGTTVDDLEVRNTPKGEFYFHTQTTKSMATTELIPSIIRHIIYNLPWPKNMTWATTTKTWVRPIEGGVALFDGKPVEFSVPMTDEDAKNPYEVHFHDITVGHRFLAPSPFKVKSFDDYVRKLNKTFVVVDHNERKKAIERQIQALLDEHNLDLKEDIGLLEEVTGLVEWPVCLLGKIDSAFMKLPPEVLRTSMRVHQRYFSVLTKSGETAPYFIVVANINALDGGATLVTGNERVLKARLSDAVFFYDNDQSKPLSVHGQRLTTTVFHADLGTLAQKQDRLTKLIEFLKDKFHIDPNDENISSHYMSLAKQAATLCKADLMTEMVYEFPELQGIMGSYYAKAEGYDNAVCDAIYHQYAPKGPTEPLPSGPVAQLLALADRIDTLVGFFSVGLMPTGSKDPFALRRSALGIIRYLETDRFSVALTDIFDFAFALYDTTKNTQKALPKDEVLSHLDTFMKDRLKIYWRDQGIHHGFVSAILETSTNESLHTVKQRLDALVSFANDQKDHSENLFSGYKRTVNILKKEKTVFQDSPQETLFEKEHEKNLFQELVQAESQMAKALAEKDYQQALMALAPLRTPVDNFFEHVQVNDDRSEIRINRLKLLSYIQKTYDQYANFSKL